MFRKDLIELLRDRPMTVVQVARELRESPADVAAGLHHLLRSLRHTEFAAEVAPARCRKCGFEFGRDKLLKPSKCPDCRSTWLAEPRVAIRPQPRKDEAEDDSAPTL